MATLHEEGRDGLHVPSLTERVPGSEDGSRSWTAAPITGPSPREPSQNQQNQPQTLPRGE